MPRRYRSRWHREQSLERADISLAERYIHGSQRQDFRHPSVGKNYRKTKNYQCTPIGHFKIEKRRGVSYYDPTRGYGARYWTAFKDEGLYRFESVPFDENGKVIKAEAEKLGQKVTKKHNIKAYGSIRLSVPDAQWIEENIPAKTLVVIDSQDDKRDAWEYLKVD